MMRFFCLRRLYFLFAILTAAAILGVPAVSQAAGTIGGGDGPQVSTHVTTGSGGSGGNVTYFTLHNNFLLNWLTDQGDTVNNPADSSLPQKLRYDYRDNAWMTKALLGYTGGPPPVGNRYPNGTEGTRCTKHSPFYNSANTYCPLWKDKLQIGAAGGVADWKVHPCNPQNRPAAPVYKPSVGTPSCALNVVIWRFDPSHPNTSEEPIFSRTIYKDGDASAFGVPTRDWFFWGNPNKNSSKGGNPKAGIASAGREDGPAYPFPAGLSIEKRECNKLYRNGDNGKRHDPTGTIPGIVLEKPGTGIAGQKGDLVSRIRPKKAPYVGSSGTSTTGRTLTCYWEGKDIGPRYWDYGNKVNSDFPGTKRPHGLATDQFGNGWEGTNPLETGGLKEAITLSWHLPSGKGNTQVRWGIQGVPNHWYAVQFTLLSNRSQLVPIIGGWAKNNHFGDNLNYFKAFVASPVSTKICVADPCNPKCNGDPADPCPSNEPGDPPKVNVSLAGNDTTQIRVNSKYTANLMPAEAFTDDQAVFPLTSLLYQSTPQNQYNGSNDAASSVNGAGYGDNYAKFSSSKGVFPSVRISQSKYGPKPVNRVLQRQPSSAEAGTGESDPLAENTFTINWLRPTLASPCTATHDVRDVTTGNWLAQPSSPATCVSSSSSTESDDINNNKQVQNVWDDYLAAISTWESHWVKSANQTPVYGTVDQPLRCSDAPAFGQPGPSISNPAADEDCGKTDPNQLNVWLSGDNNQQAGLFAQQKAQGYLHATGNVSKNEKTAQVRVQLKTNRPDKVTGAALVDRDAGVAVGPNTNNTGDSENPLAAVPMSNTARAIKNGVTSQPELNFCKQGLPPGTKLAAPNPDRTVSASEEGDPNCRGYAVKWDWKADSCTDSGGKWVNCEAAVCNAKSGVAQTAAPGVADYPAPQNPNDLHLFKWGVYGTHDAFGISTENPGGYKSAIQSSNGTIIPPYEGDRPGASANQIPCSRNFVEPGWATDGSWEITYDWVARNQQKQNHKVSPHQELTCTFSKDDFKYAGGAVNYKLLNEQKPVAAMPDGDAAQQCPTSIAGTAKSPRYSWGYWYRSSVKFVWNKSSTTCKPRADFDHPNANNETPNGNLVNNASSFATSPKYSMPSPLAYYGVDFGSLYFAGDTSRNINAAEFADRGCFASSTRKGYLTDGVWKLGKNAGVGWGLNNTGPRVPNGSYMPWFTFTGLTTDELQLEADGLTQKHDDAVGTRYSMLGVFDGRTDEKWVHAQDSNYANSGGVGQFGEPSVADPSGTGVYEGANATMTVKVYAPRNNR